MRESDCFACLGGEGGGSAFDVLEQLAVELVRRNLVERCEFEKVHDTRHGDAVFPAGKTVGTLQAEKFCDVSLSQTDPLSVVSKVVGDCGCFDHGDSVCE